jgi:hypothetical protein
MNLSMLLLNNTASFNEITSGLPMNSITDAIVFNRTLYYYTYDGTLKQRSLNTEEDEIVKKNCNTTKFDFIPFPTLSISLNPHIRISGFGEPIILPLPSTAVADGGGGGLLLANNVFLYLLDVIFILLMLIILRFLYNKKQQV